MFENRVKAALRILADIMAESRDPHEKRTFVMDRTVSTDDDTEAEFTLYKEAQFSRDSAWALYFKSSCPEVINVIGQLDRDMSRILVAVEAITE